MGAHSFNNTLGAKLLHAAPECYKHLIPLIKYNHFLFTEKLLRLDCEFISSKLFIMYTHIHTLFLLHKLINYS